MSENKANPNKLAYVGSATRNSNTWYTPEKYITSARKALGGVIYLDPFSSDAANSVVQATKYFTVDSDAFTQDWYIPDEVTNRTAFMNPPYSGALVKSAVTRFLIEFQNRSFDAGVLLVNNATETSWFQRCLGLASGVCFTDHRISFWNEDGKSISANTRGQAFLYFGEGLFQFVDAFDEHGFILTPAQQSSESQTYPHL